MAIVHTLGFPRIGAKRELKKAVEAYWRGEIDQTTLIDSGRSLRRTHWDIQAQAGVDLLPVGDFSWYDHVLDMSILLGVVPPRFERTRFKHNGGEVDLDLMFRMARGRAPTGKDAQACEMTKWFNNNYHYIVPELQSDQLFQVSSSKLFDEVREALALGYQCKPVIVGPLTYLWLSKAPASSFDKLLLLEPLIQAYRQILIQLKSLGVQWVQIDEPILVLDLPEPWRVAFNSAYEQLNINGLNMLLATYFEALGENTDLTCRLPTAGLHIDLVSAPQQLHSVLNAIDDNKILSIGIVDGRNVWISRLNHILNQLQPIHARLGERLWIAPSCSLLHCPVDLESETKLDTEIKSWLAFAVQKLHELHVIKRGLNKGERAVQAALNRNNEALHSRASSLQVHNADVKTRLSAITPLMAQRHSVFNIRYQLQHDALKLPAFPTTTIGSLPQTGEIRSIRSLYKNGKASHQEYKTKIHEHIAYSIAMQEQAGLDVLVHGEAERNDMVEFFGEQLHGFAITQHGWVQSYGSRCVKPPLIYGDIYRAAPMTLEWLQYAKTLTDKPVKGMLTGPVTILHWSFVRDDQSKEVTCRQIALALRDEVNDLQSAGFTIIQIDEPAIREGLPLRGQAQQAYLDWAVECFKLTAGIAEDTTQIHTHMCYSDFNRIISAIAQLDADVITIESARSDMKLLQAFLEFRYPNAIGPGCYDIHSPCEPDAQSIASLLKNALRYIPAEQLWVNPDCGLKTRNWEEVIPALRNMVHAAKAMRVQVM